MATFAALMISVGCGETEQTPTEVLAFEILHERELTGEAPPQDIASLVEGNTQFALEIYAKLANPSENLIFSPLSISRAFSNYYKAGGVNEDQFLGVFHYLPDPVASEQAFRALSVQLMSRDTTKERASFFESSDIYWVDSGQASELDNLNFDRVHALPFSEDPEYARGVINGWISERSRGLLPEFLDQGTITPDTFRVTTNVIFFIGNWAHKYQSRSLSFQGPTGTKDVKAFGTEEDYRYRVAEDHTTVQIPYTEGYSLVLVMPDDLEAFQNTLTTSRLAELFENLEWGSLDLTIPEIETSSEPDIVAAISALREDAGFDSGSTLTGAYDEAYIHKAVIKADKDGTTAAAATAVIEYGNNAPEFTIINFDRPFVYFIIEDSTDSILFLGHFVGE